MGKWPPASQMKTEDLKVPKVKLARETLVLQNILKALRIRWLRVGPDQRKCGNWQGLERRRGHKAIKAGID